MCVTTKSKLKCPCDFSLLQRIETTHGVMFYAEEFDRDEWVWSESSLCHNASSHGLLAEGEGERVCCCSDLVLRLHMGHVFCISVADGHHPVSYPDTSLSCLAARGQLEKKKTSSQKCTRGTIKNHINGPNTKLNNRAIFVSILHLVVLRTA